MSAHAVDAREPAIAHGPPLAAESGIGALTLGGYLRDVTARFGAREAAVMRRDGEAVRWSYDMLWAKAQAVARALAACGIAKGARVGILATNRLEFLSSLFGAALAGGVATPISTFFTAAELAQAVRLSACSVLILERAVLKKDFAVMLAGIDPAIATASPGTLVSREFPFLRHLAMLDGDEAFGCIEGWAAFLARGDAIDPEQVERRAADVAPADPGLLFFSSGSTGRPKGILSAHRGACLQLWRWARWYRIADPAARTWSANGFFFSGNFCMAFGSALSTGGTLVLQRFFDAEEALRLVEEERATMMLAWPHQWAQIVAAADYDAADLSSLHYLDTTVALARHPTVDVTWREPAQAYGSTETFTLISVYPANTDATTHRGSHGVPTAGSTIKIVDPLTGETTRIGERGEIAVRGPTLMLGYVGVPLDETLDDDGFFRTGDGGYLDEGGRLFWEGRLSDIIKTGGANVSPLEVDEVLRGCPGVKLTQTVGVPDPLLGEIVVACVVPHAGASLDEEAVRSFARQALASYKLPRRVLFFAEEQLKTTGSAKIKTADLRKLAAACLADEAAGEAI